MKVQKRDFLRFYSCCTRKLERCRRPDESIQQYCDPSAQLSVCLSVCLSVRLFELKSGALQCSAEKLVRLIALCERLLIKSEQKAAYFNRFQLSVKYGMRVADKGATSSSNTTGSIEQRGVSESTAHKTRLTSDSRHNTDI